MASYSVFIGLKDAGGSFVPNADAIALFLCSAYQQPINENTVIGNMTKIRRIRK
mgnify:CR=1 FL=1